MSNCRNTRGQFARCSTGRGRRSQIKANAAPALYAALKEAVENLIAFTDDPPLHPIPYDVSVALPRLQKALASASPTPLWWEGTEYDVR